MTMQRRDFLLAAGAAADDETRVRNGSDQSIVITKGYIGRPRKGYPTSSAGRTGPRLS